MKWKYTLIALPLLIMACNSKTEIKQENKDTNQTLETIFNRKSVRK